ncbi:MAG: metalloregulator ArsR/SmtB family transcription factor [Planctomycetota bacterium]|nr:metalloregulator ArsR/SmtB family transcription factor [Planctomycetota bacterium]
MAHDQPKDIYQSEHCAELLKALAEPLRLRIVEALRERPRNVGEIADALGVEVVIASHHLGILRNVGLVERQKQGRFAVYSLRPGLSTQGHIDLGCCELRLPNDDRR